MEQDNRVWWQKPLRIIQPNLQVKDTDKIDPERLASQLAGLGANAVVFNVGGIYAWYPTKVDCHIRNSYLPETFDLLKSVIDACHKRDIRFIARLDFSRAEDTVYLRHPQWFARDPEGKPIVTGALRPGPWPLLMDTCINGAYRNEAVAMPVIHEVLDNYEIDGIFYNAPDYTVCFCDGCRRTYLAHYGKPLPDRSDEFEADWPTFCMRNNMEKLYRLVKGKRSELPMILYYNLYRDNLFDRAATSDMLCTEPQDVLSLGHRNIPEFWKPALCMKLGRSLPDRPAPLGIVHSCPGMDWRHTGLPAAEYRFWLSQIPAYGGSIWHSLTGIPDTIGDKRILDVVSAFNQDMMKVEHDMDGAVLKSQVALLWTADASSEGMADGLIANGIPFDTLLAEQVIMDHLAHYDAVIIPEGFRPTEEQEAAIESYVLQGGCALAEGFIPPSDKMMSLLGIANDVYASEPLIAAYLRFEEPGVPLKRGLKEVELIAFRGKVLYCRPEGENTQVWATLVPPFSPLEAVGRPPERASLPVSHTDLPLVLANPVGEGKTVYFPFSLSGLMNEFKLPDHYQLFANTINHVLEDRRMIETKLIPGLQTTLFEKDENWLIHLVNGVGRRPLSANIPIYAIEIKLRLPANREVADVRMLIAGQEVPYQIQADGKVLIIVPELLVWECILVQMKHA